MQRFYVVNTKVRHQPAYPTATHSRPLTYKNWSTKQLGFALSAIREGHSQRRVAEEYGIPRSTLGDYVREQVLPGSRSGHLKYLNDAEEAELYRFLVRCAAVGYPRSRKDVIAVVQRACDSKGMDVHITHGWWESYCRRFPDLRSRTVASLSSCRAMASDPEIISAYFDMLEKTLSENKLLNKPTQIYNLDETGMPLGSKPLKGICLKGSNPHSITSGLKAQITVVACVNAAGWTIPPMVIWDRKTMAADFAAGEVPGTVHAFSSNGWIDKELFDLWFNHLFLKSIPPVRPVLLLMDGHSTHYCPETIKEAAKQQIVMFTLPPNTTHLSQPLDKGCFSALKMKWREVCHEYMIKNPGKVVSRFCFSSLFRKAWNSAMSAGNVQAGFETTGVYPLNRAKLLPSDEESLVGEDLPYMPMITPSRPSCASVPDSHNTSVLDLQANYMYNNTSRPLQDLLSYPSPLHQLPTLKLKGSSRVLTSDEFIDKMEATQRKKALDTYLKEERKYLRELKKQDFDMSYSSVQNDVSLYMSQPSICDNSILGTRLTSEVSDESLLLSPTDSLTDERTLETVSTKTRNTRSKAVLKKSSVETPVVTRGKTRGATGLKPTTGDSLTDERTLETVSTKTHNTRSKPVLKKRSVETPVVTRGTREATGLKPTAGALKKNKATLLESPPPKTLRKGCKTRGAMLTTALDTGQTSDESLVLSPTDSLTDERTLETVSTKTHNTRSKPVLKKNSVETPVVTRGKTRGATGLKPTAGDSLTDERTLETVSTKTRNTRSKAALKKSSVETPVVTRGTREATGLKPTAGALKNSTTLSDSPPTRNLSSSLKSWIPRLRLSEYDRKSLRSHGWLSANHISAAQMILKSMFPYQNGLEDTTYLIEKLRWTSSVDKFVQIIHVNGCHWACVSNKFSRERNVVQMYDSLPATPSASVIEQVCTILKCEEPEVRIEMMNVQLQQASDTCGLYSIAVAHDLCAGKDPCYISYKESTMRSHLEQCFKTNTISKFPSEGGREVRKKVIEEVKVLVYCTCRYPDTSTRFGNMARCDFCGEWFHEDCVGNIPQEVFEEDAEYVCNNCQF